MDEMLYPELFLYWSDLLAYVAVGARSVEDQGNLRLAASNFDLPVGMKNPMNGDVETLLNSIKAAQLLHRLWCNKVWRCILLVIHMHMPFCVVM